MSLRAALPLALALSLIACSESSPVSADAASVPVTDAASDGASDAPADVAADAPPACEPATTTQPSPRADAAGAIDPVTGELVVFGGDDGPTVMCIPRPTFRGDLWRYDPRCDRWREVATSDGPSARSRMAYALDTRRRRLLVFGGRFRAGATGAYTLYRELWSLDLATDAWTRLTPDGAGPSARANASAVYDPDGDAFIVYGGNTSTDGTRFAPLSDVWRLDLQANAWSRVSASGGPSARLFHAAAYRGGAMVVYGGGGANAFTGPFNRDIWSLDLAGASWRQLTLRGDTRELIGRISSALVPDPMGDGFLLVAGHDDAALGNRNDVFTVSPEGAVSMLRAGDILGTPGAGFCDFPADFAVTDEESPERRSAFVLAEDPARQRVLIYGGKTDCGLAGDVWALERAPLRWRPLRGTNDGLSCVRSGREGCTSLCN